MSDDEPIRKQQRTHRRSPPPGVPSHQRPDPKEYDRRAVRSIACPKASCQAKPRQFCQNKRDMNTVLDYEHDERIAAYKAAQVAQKPAEPGPLPW